VLGMELTAPPHCTLFTNRLTSQLLISLCADFVKNGMENSHIKKLSYGIRHRVEEKERKVAVLNTLMFVGKSV
jgi:hypothetical protein